MKFVKRKLGEKRILYAKGKLKMVDGSSIKKYLKSWAKACAVEEDTAMVLMPSDYYERLERDAFMWRNCGGLG